MSEANDKGQETKAEATTAIVRKRPKPELVPLHNGKLISSDGRFHQTRSGEMDSSRRIVPNLPRSEHDTR